MRFLIRLKKKPEVSPRDVKQLTDLAYSAVKGLGGDVGNLRVSSSAVELDLLLDSETNLKRAVAVLESAIGSLVTLRKLDLENPAMERAEAVRLGLNYFNEGRYWESHEALELAWHKSMGAEKDVLQGIILVAAAFVHLQKDEQDVALSILKRAYEKVRNYHGDYFGINLDLLRSRVNQIIVTGKPSFFEIETNPERSD